MRMWMVDSKKMCRKHLGAEYVECLMIAACMKRKRRLDGYFAHNCIEPKSLVSRFAELKKEMLRRGYRARRTLLRADFSYLPAGQQRFRIDRKASSAMLYGRCAECRKAAGKA